MNEFSGLHAVVWKFLDVRDQTVKRQFCDAELNISEAAEEIAMCDLQVYSTKPVIVSLKMHDLQ